MEAVKGIFGQRALGGVAGSPHAPKHVPKYADVDLIRGFAALAVVVYHFLLAFVPAQAAPDIAETLGIVVEPPILLALVNGPFMVSVFFVLSSFVLTARLVREASVRTTLVAMAKRFPRLLPLTLVGSLLPAVLLIAGLMANGEASTVTGSAWLDRSGGIKDGAAWPEPSLPGAAIDALLLYERGLSQYNSALWTMKYELIGSLLALATALLIGARRRPVVDAAIVLAVGAVAMKIHPLCSICVGAVYLTKYVALSPPDIGRWSAFGLVFAGFLLGSTYKIFPEELLTDDWMRRQVLRADWLLHGLGAMLLFVGLRCFGELPMQNRWIGRQLGRLSFPVYVLHIPVQASLASAIVIALGYDWSVVVLAFFVSTASIFLLAVPVARFDEWWVRRLNAVSRRVASALPRPPGRNPVP